MSVEPGVYLREAAKRAIADPGTVTLPHETSVDGTPTPRTVYHLLTDRATQPFDVIRPSYYPGVDVVPSSIDLAAAELASGACMAMSRAGSTGRFP